MIEIARFPASRFTDDYSQAGLSTDERAEIRRRADAIAPLCPAYRRDDPETGDIVIYVRPPMRR